jgi:hypothetical protein
VQSDARGEASLNASVNSSVVRDKLSENVSVVSDELSENENERSGKPADDDSAEMNSL